jgi:hopanoid biosynthesis associated radical SAM protein HpnJ
MMKTLLLNPPSFAGFDGGGSSRWPATREIESYWYPVWLAYPAALIPQSRLLDAPPHGVSPEETIRIAASYDFAVVFTSTPGFHNDVRLAERMKAARPQLHIAFVGPHVTALPEQSLRASDAIDFVVRGEFDYAVAEFAAGAPLDAIRGVSFRRAGDIVHTPPRPLIDDLDALPWVTPVYKRDLDVRRYTVPFLRHPYIALYTTRGCPARCTFCLWPQTLDGHIWRQRSVDDVVHEVVQARRLFPEVEEIFFDDDTFTFSKARVLALCDRLKPLKLTWSCTARVHVDLETLRAMRAAGCRLLIVGFESGDPQILKNVKKGATVEQARAFMRNCKRAGLLVHGDFIVGLPGETPESIARTIAFAKELDCDTIQVSLAHAYPGTEFYRFVQAHGYLRSEVSMTDAQGHQLPHVEYPGLSRLDMLEAVERFYAAYYFRPRIVARFLRKALLNAKERRRLYKEAREYLRLRAERRRFIARQRT